MSSLASSYKGADAATAFARGMSPERFAERSEAYASKEASDQKLEMLQKTKPTDEDYAKQSEINSEKLDLALGEINQAKRQQNLQTTYQAFQRYDADKFDVKHFNQLLTDFDARDAKLFSNISRVDRINTMHIPMMDDWGISKAHQKLILENPDVKGSYVAITTKDGRVEFGDMDALKRFAGGYNDYATEQEIGRQTRVKTLEMLTRFGLPTDNDAIQAFNETKQDFPEVDPSDPDFVEAFQARYTELRTLGRSSGHETNERAYASRAMRNLGIEPGDPRYDGMYNDFVEEHRNLVRPSKLKQLDAADVAEDKLVEMGFGEQKRSELSPQDERAMGRQIRRLEQAGGQEMDSDTKKHLMRIRGLVELGDTAGDLTESQTGIIDNLLSRAKMYIYDEAPDNIAAKSAYASYRNKARNILFGSVLPATEITNFAESFGSFGMQLGPILGMLRQNVEQLRNDYQALYELNNPMVIEWHSGMTKQRLDETIAKLDHRIGMIDAVANDNVTTESPVIKPSENIELDPEWEQKFDASFPQGAEQ